MPPMPLRHDAACRVTADVDAIAATPLIHYDMPLIKMLSPPFSPHYLPLRVFFMPTLMLLMLAVATPLRCL